MTTLLPTGLMVIEGDTHLSHWLKEAKGELGLGGGDAVLDTALQHIVPGNTVIDLGCNLGIYSRYFAQAVGPAGRLFGFDPNPECIVCARVNCPFPWAKFACCAVGAMSGLSYLRRMENVGASYLRMTSGPDDQPCPVLPLDVALAGNHEVHMIKIDCEGFEHEVLRGAVQTINHHRPVMIIEINEPALNRRGVEGKDVLHLLDKLRYQVSPIPVTAPMSGDQYDVLARPLP